MTDPTNDELLEAARAVLHAVTPVVKSVLQQQRAILDVLEKPIAEPLATVGVQVPSWIIKALLDGDPILQQADCDAAINATLSSLRDAVVRLKTPAGAGLGRVDRMTVKALINKHRPENQR